MFQLVVRNMDGDIYLMQKITYTHSGRFCTQIMWRRGFHTVLKVKITTQTPSRGYGDSKNGNAIGIQTNFEI